MWHESDWKKSFPVFDVQTAENRMVFQLLVSEMWCLVDIWSY